MSHNVESVWLNRYDRILRLIQRRVADQIKTPFEIRLWGDRSYVFGKGTPAVKVLVKDKDGLLALSTLDELGICEAYMAGRLDVIGDMLGFVSLRGMLSDSHPLHRKYNSIIRSNPEQGKKPNPDCHTQIDRMNLKDGLKIRPEE